MKNLVKEALGSGFAMNGQSGGNDNSMYTYDIKALTHVLEQPITQSPSEVEDIHIGLTIQGKKFTDNKTVYSGKLIDILRKNDDIEAYVILDEESKTKMKLDPNTVTIIHNDDIPTTTDIWDYQLKDNGNLFAPKNEGRLVAESLEELNESQGMYIKGEELKDVKEQLKNSKKIPKEMKDVIEPMINKVTTYKDGKLFRLNIPEISGKSFNGVDLGVDKDGFFVYTHRARSKSYKEIKDIPNKDIKFIETTG